MSRPGAALKSTTALPPEATPPMAPHPMAGSAGTLGRSIANRPTVQMNMKLLTSHGCEAALSCVPCRPSPSRKPRLLHPGPGLPGARRVPATSVHKAAHLQVSPPVVCTRPDTPPWVSFPRCHPWHASAVDGPRLFHHGPDRILPRLPMTSGSLTGPRSRPNRFLPESYPFLGMYPSSR